LINENIYWHGTGKISSFLNRLLHEVLGCAPTIIMMIFFCNVNIFLLLDEFPPKIIPYCVSHVHTVLEKPIAYN
jgi:hypothetical protein